MTCHLHNVKVSCQAKQAVEDSIQSIKNEYENFTEVKPSQGKVHDYLAMISDYSETGKVKGKMGKYIEAMYNNPPLSRRIRKWKSDNTSNWKFVKSQSQLYQDQWEESRSISHMDS